MRLKKLTRAQKIKMGHTGVIREKAKRVELERKRKAQKLDSDLKKI